MDGEKSVANKNFRSHKQSSQNRHKQTVCRKHSSQSLGEKTKMSDVFDGLVEKLKQKAKTGWDIEYLLTHKRYSVLGVEWVRLEDVKAILQQLKQKYVIIEKEKLRKIYDDLRVDKISGYQVNSEFFKLIRELLKE